MTAQFASCIDSSAYQNPSNFHAFFSKADQSKISSEYVWTRECTDPAHPPSCDLNLFFGYFFDGTNNNLKRDRPTHGQSSIARLYEAFPGSRDDHGSEPWPDLQSKYHNCFFRTYVPGVGTEFRQVNDSGKGLTLRDDRPKGLGFCYLGENRIIWALVQALNHVHRYYTDALLISDDEYLKRFNRLTLPSFAEVTRPSYLWSDTDPHAKSELDRLRDAFVGALRKLHANLQLYLPIGAGKHRDCGVVQNIYVSMFGFSRGATKARVFANWFNWLCRLDADLCGGARPSLGTIPVTVDFIGLFDSVASVGVAASLWFADGHQAWADAEASLRIPGAVGPAPARCLHLVSGHEVRRSFPVDSILYRGELPANCDEIVFPGVHSDVGGGYRPGEHGIGTDPEGADLVSRIALATMYRAARLAGVPLKLEEAPESVQRSFRIAPSVITAFNAYLDAYRADERPLSGPLHVLMEHQHELYIRWRKQMLGRMPMLPGFADCDGHEQADILASDHEFQEEIGHFLRWREQKDNPYREGPVAFATFREWEVIDRYWDEPVPPEPVADFFAHFVHDSRASFKPLGDDLPALQDELDKLILREDRGWELTTAEKNRLKGYKLSKERNGGHGDHRDAIDPAPDGREPLWLGGGYLRYRRLYMGSDSFKPEDARYASAVPAEPGHMQEQTALA